MSKKIRSLTEAQACKLLNVTLQQLQFLLQAADQVMQEIAPDVCSLYKKGAVPRYDMIEMVCDCDRITRQIMQMRRMPSAAAEAAVEDLIAKFKAASIEVKYGVVGIELSSRVFVM